MQRNSQLDLFVTHYPLIYSTLKQATAAAPTLRMSQQNPIEILKLPRSCSAGRDSDKHQSWELIPQWLSNQDHIWSAKTPGDVARSTEARSAQILIPGLALELAGFCWSVFTPEPQVYTRTFSVLHF